jgi:DNA-3-methyladenine glycosylase I
VYIAYHDNEWGVPVHDDRKLFEMLVLEGFQAGLSWITILKRRGNFRAAFANFDWKKVAAFSDRDIERLMNDRGIIRNRLKILAAINNARRFIEVRADFGTFDRYIWQFTGNTTLMPATRASAWKDVPCRSAESDALSKDLRKRGFAFVGTVICYSHMQATGMVDDHMAGCFKAQIPQHPRIKTRPLQPPGLSPS